MRGGGAIGGAIFRSVVESSLESAGRRSDAASPPLSVTRDGIFVGLFGAGAATEAPKVEDTPDETELDKV